MYIEKITLTNFRGASDLTMEFDRHLNVFYGENGAGKSTVLDAAAIMLSWLIPSILYGSTSGEPISRNDINNSASHSSVEIACRSKNELIEWSLFTEGLGNVEDENYEESNELDEVRQYGQAERMEFISSDGEMNLPLFVYYSVGRSVQDIALKTEEKNRFDIRRGYNNALSGQSDFGNFFSWFKDREDLENEKMIDKGVIEYSDSQLDAVRMALEHFLPDFKNLRIRRRPLRMEVEKKGKILTVNQLSGGEKMMIAMVGDIAQRIAILNPTLDNCLEGKGIVLIDEIDLHLHPKWQRTIILQLQKTFPNCQFIISTHSPHVLNHVQPKNLFVLTQTPENIEVSHPYTSYGKNVDRVLEDLMGVPKRPDDTKNKFRELFKNISDNNLDEARRQLQSLKIEIKEDPELVKAEVLIKRMELIGK